MIKAIFFDLDGVLVDTKLIHFEALNFSLYKILKKKISFKDHVEIYDGLPTVEKLKILKKKIKISKINENKIIKLKQKKTKEFLKKKIKFNKKIYSMINILSKKYKIAIATNATKSTLDLILNKLKIKKFINYQISNEEIFNPKPHPEIYLKCLLSLKLRPKETIILEDSHYGRQAAQETNCHLMPIRSLKDVSINSIKKSIKAIDKNNKFSLTNKWVDNKLNILIPMAGLGSRFKDAGYIFPKPLIEIREKTMIQMVVDSLNIGANYIFIIQKKHQKKFNLISTLRTMVPNCKIIEIDGLTDGAACTTLLAKKYINNSNPLIIANSDQYIEWNSSKTLYNFYTKDFDGGILTFESIHPKWSYAKCDNNQIVKEVAEKKVISKNATVGVYYWKKGSDYVNYANKMIKNNKRVNNEFYVCPVYNEAINDGKKIAISHVDKMYGLGTPEDLKNYLEITK
tara:strand:- start:118 stop:1488 length:1371 start_codon:yes stop_codon:yes gene_type:complete